jgi:hypothetical protein
MADPFLIVVDELYLPNSFERPGPKSVSPATNCSGVDVIDWWSESWTCQGRDQE